MAKRKRKMTLFDVINTGQPIGLQYRPRVPTYQPTPELPVKKKLARLFGRRAKADDDRPLTAAEELARLRQELAPKDQPRAHVEEADATDSDPTASFFGRRNGARDESRVESHAESHSESHAVSGEVIEAPGVMSPATRRRIAELAAASEAAEREAAPAKPPRAPGKPIGQRASEVWTRLSGAVSPKLAAAKAAILRATRSGASQLANVSKLGGGQLREYATRYGITTAVATGVVVLLLGSFYAGKLLFNRPAVPLTGTDLVSGDVRPDVLNVDNSGVRANEAVANVSERTEARLEKTVDKTAKPAPISPQSNLPFGGRKLDLNYVIIQSYRTPAEAQAVVDVLAKRGISTTVEQGLRGYQGWYSVVSTDGFAKMGGNDIYQRFLATIATISEQERGVSLPGRLDPRPYKHQAAN